MAAGKGGGSQTITTRMDPSSQRYLEQFIRPLGQTAAMQMLGMSPGGFGGGGGGFGPGGFGGGGFDGRGGGMGGVGTRHLWGQAQAQHGGGMGGGGPDFMGHDFGFGGSFFPDPTNPYQEQVIDAANLDFDRARALSNRGTAQEATMAGAGRGSRSAVLQATREAEIERARGQTLAGIRHGGFEANWQRDMLARQEPLFRAQTAMEMANLGFGPMPGSQVTQPYHSNRFGSGIGGAAVGSRFGPLGAGAGFLGGYLFGG